MVIEQARLAKELCCCLLLQQRQATKAGARKQKVQVAGVSASVGKAPAQPSAGSSASTEAHPAQGASSDDKPKQAVLAAGAAGGQERAAQTEEAHEERAGVPGDGAAQEAGKVRAQDSSGRKNVLVGGLLQIGVLLQADGVCSIIAVLQAQAYFGSDHERHKCLECAQLVLGSCCNMRGRSLHPL